MNQNLKAAPENNKTAQKGLSSKAAKKNVKSEEPVVHLKTRKLSFLKPENQKRLKKFNLKNFNLVENKQELRFMGHEMVKMLDAKMSAMGLNPEEKAAEVAFYLKAFQTSGVFAHCDSMVFTSVGNTVRYEYINIIILVYR